MALTQDERNLAQTLKASGKDNTEILRIIAKRRTGEGISQEPNRQPNTVAELAKGVGKGIASTLAAADVLPTMKALAGENPSFTGQTIEERNKSFEASNNIQAIGKGATVAAEIAIPIAAPFAATRLASLMSRAPRPAAPTGLLDTAKATGNKIIEAIRNPKLALSKANIDDKVELSAERLTKQPLFAEGTVRLDDPLTSYEEYLAQSKKALTDIKEDPALATVGNKIGDAFKFVVERRRDAGKVMGEELKKVGSIKLSAPTVTDDFLTATKEGGLKFNAKERLFTATKDSKFSDADLAILNEYAGELTKLGKNPTVSQIDAFLSRTDANLRNFKASKSIVGTTNAERLVSQSQRALRDLLANSDTPELANYARARALFSDLSDFVNEGASHLGSITQSGDFAKDASLAKSAVQSILNNGKKDWLTKLEELSGYPALDDSVLALQAMKDAGDFRGLSLLQALTEGGAPLSKAGITQKAIDFAIDKASRLVAGTPEEQTRAFLKALKEAVENQ